jgi:conjugal transfer pilus assembly protein TraW
MVITAIAAVAVLASHCAHARDLGVIGPVYAIAEPSLLEVIQTKLRQMQANGDLSRLQRESQARIQREVEQPAPVPGITKTTRARSFHFDPSIEVPYPITDAEGRVSIRSTPCRCRVPCCSSMPATPPNSTRRSACSANARAR